MYSLIRYESGVFAFRMIYATPTKTPMIHPEKIKEMSLVWVNNIDEIFTANRSKIFQQYGVQNIKYLTEEGIVDGVDIPNVTDFDVVTCTSYGETKIIVRENKNGNITI